MKVTVIGVGNQWRYDDAAGLIVSKLVEQKAKKMALGLELCFCNCPRESMELIESLQQTDIAIIVDAVVADVPPGTVFMFDLAEQELPEKVFSYSTHAFSVNQSIQLAKILGKAPDRLFVVGVQGGDFSQGQGLTAAVAEGCEQAAQQISQLMQRLC